MLICRHHASYSRWTIINSWLGTGLKHVQLIQVKASPNLDVGLNIEGIEPSNWTYIYTHFFLKRHYRMNQKSIIHFYMLNCNRVFGTDRHWLLLSPSFHSSNMFDMFGQAHVSGWIGTLRHFLLHNETCLSAVCYIDKYRWVLILIYQNTFRWTNSKTFAWFNTLILEANVRSFWLFTCWLWDDSKVSKLNTCH